jgi:hypothetical protein
MVNGEWSVMSWKPFTYNLHFSVQDLFKSAENVSRKKIHHAHFTTHFSK